MNEETDEAVARRVQHGDQEAFGILVERYQDKLLRYGRKFLANRADVEDLVQDSFLKAYEHIQSFRPAQSFSSWIYRIAHNAFVNGLRSKSRNTVFALDLDTLIPHMVYEDPALRERELQELKQVLESGLDRIPVSYREVLVLYYLEELSYKEIADVLRIPVGTVGIRLSRARTALRKQLDPDTLP